MHLNVKTAICTSKVLLVPYSKWHVPQYHEWMKDEEIRLLTASEPLTLSEEYGMQESWRGDADKLTFIVCLPAQESSDGVVISSSLSDKDDAPDQMIGDINLFLRMDDGEEGDLEPSIIGEVELMIARSKDQSKGFGRSALLTFLRYIAGHEREIVGEFVGKDELASKAKDYTNAGKARLKFSALSVKIGHSNQRSLALFESFGFRKVSEEVNYFGEWELRRTALGVEGIEKELTGAGVGGYREVVYERSA